MKKIIFQTLLFMTISLCVNAQLHPVSNEKGKWGYENDNGVLVIKYKFAGASEFEDGIAMVRDGNKYGIIDETGAYKIKPKYDMISPFNNFGLAEVMEGDKHGFVNKSGEMVIPCKYKFVGSFNSNGIVWVNDGGSIKKGSTNVTGGKFSVFSTDGKNHFGGEYGTIGIFVPWKTSYSSEALDKMTQTERRLTEGENYSFWRKRQFLFIPGTSLPSDAHAFYVAKNSDGSYNGVCMPNGVMLIPPGKYYFANCPEDNISIVYPNKNSRNFLDIPSGKLILQNGVEDSWGFSNGHCLAKSGGLWYVYDKSGNQKSAGYTQIYPCNNGVHVVRNGNDKYGLISSYGNELIKAENYSVYPCIDGLCLVKKTSSSPVGYVDKYGIEAIPAEYSAGMNFNAGYAMVGKDGKWGMIDKSGAEVIPFEFYSMKLRGDADNRMFWCLREKDGLWECYDIQNKQTVIPAKYADVRPFDATHDGLAVVKVRVISSLGNDDESWGWIDKAGNVVVPCRFNENLVFKAAREYVNSGRAKWNEYTDFLFNLHNMKIQVPISSKADESLWDY